MTKTKQELVLKFNTIDEVEKAVYELVKSGKNFRDIAKTSFDIAGNVKRFNPSQISKIKAKFEPKLPENNRDPDKATVFALFKKNKKPTDVIIETGLSFEYVKKSYTEFLEFEGKMLVPKFWIDNLEGFANFITEPHGNNKLGNIHYAFSVAKNSHLELESHVYNCCVCEEVMPIKDKSLQSASEHLSKSWGHAECIKNKDELF